MSASSGERKSLQPEIPSERTVQLCARSRSEAQQVWVVMCCLWVSAVRDSSRGGRRGAGGLSWWQESSAERTTTHIVRRAFFQPGDTVNNQRTYPFRGTKFGNNLLFPFIKEIKTFRHVPSALEDNAAKWTPFNYTLCPTRKQRPKG